VSLLLSSSAVLISSMLMTFGSIVVVVEAEMKTVARAEAKVGGGRAAF
jgi:hypothetical protein